MILDVSLDDNINDLWINKAAEAKMDGETDIDIRAIAKRRSENMWPGKSRNLHEWSAAEYVLQSRICTTIKQNQANNESRLRM